jgi:hypothetical protein
MRRHQQISMLTTGKTLSAVQWGYLQVSPPCKILLTIDRSALRSRFAFVIGCDSDGLQHVKLDNRKVLY